MVYRVTWQNDGSECIPCCEGSHACCTMSTNSADADWLPPAMRTCTCDCANILASLAVMQRLTNEQELAYERFMQTLSEVTGNVRQLQ